jgi:hypothetical protein
VESGESQSRGMGDVVCEMLSHGQPCSHLSLQERETVEREKEKYGEGDKERERGGERWRERDREREKEREREREREKERQRDRESERTGNRIGALRIDTTDRGKDTQPRLQ